MTKKDIKQNIYLIGAKSLGAYGGYETFVNKLTEYHQYNDSIKYHVACKSNGDGHMDENKIDGVSNIIRDNTGVTTEFTYQNARCFKIKIPENIGPAQAIYYDIKSLHECCKHIEKYNISNPIVYIMACRIGPFMRYFYNKITKLGGLVYLNPDGHEWMRAKWGYFVRKYWKYSERLMVKWSDLIICDSINIEKYIKNTYAGMGINGKNPLTTYIAYGAEVECGHNPYNNQKLQEWYKMKGIKSHEYYLVVGRFVPENNYETMIREFMKSKTQRDFVIITNVNEKFLYNLEKKLNYKIDNRIKFVGTVYDQELLKMIRENAFGYFHGHEVGGTNPSLLESLGSTKLNLLLDVGFNREVAEENALYWTKNDGSLASLIDTCDCMCSEEIYNFGVKAKERIKEAYSWEYIVSRYESVFLNIKDDNH